MRIFAAHLAELEFASAAVAGMRSTGRSQMAHRAAVEEYWQSQSCTTGNWRPGEMRLGRLLQELQAQWRAPTGCS